MRRLAWEHAHETLGPGRTAPSAGSGDGDGVIELSANIDDCSGEILSAAIEQLLAAGCLDAWATAIVMKQSRPAWLLSALCRPGDAAAATDVFFRETTTFGVRRQLLQRTKLDRTFETVETPFGPVRVKIGRRNGQVLTLAPEFADCLSAARAHAASVRDVMQAAMSACRLGGEGVS